MNRKEFLKLAGSCAVWPLACAAGLWGKAQVVPGGSASIAAAKAPERRAEPFVIAEVGFYDAPGAFAASDILTWNDVKGKLPLLKDMGANAIFLWGPFEHPSKLITTIPCWIEEDGKAKQIDLKVASWNVINLHAKNFFKPDPRRGSEEDFRTLIAEAHRLGLKVIGQFLATCVSPESLFCTEHPEWLLKTKIEGKEYWAVPDSKTPWGYIVNKSHPDFIAYVTEKVIPYWITEWNMDGIFIDSPGIPYTPSAETLRKAGKTVPPDYKPLTPVEGIYTSDPLLQAMRSKIDQLGKTLNRDLIFCAEHCDFDYKAGRYFDFIWDYEWPGMLVCEVYGRGQLPLEKMFLERLGKTVGINRWEDCSYSHGYVRYFNEEKNKGPLQFTEGARFLGNLNTFPTALKESILHVRPRWVGCSVVLNLTAPGNITEMAPYLWDVKYKDFWCSHFLNAWKGDLNVEYSPATMAKVCKDELFDIELTREWYKRCIRIKKEHPALQSRNIEDALLEPKIQGLIAYNRWDEGKDALTVVVNTTDKEIACRLKTRLREKAPLYDTLSRKKIEGASGDLRISIPAYSSMVIARAD